MKNKNLLYVFLLLFILILDNLSVFSQTIKSVDERLYNEFYFYETSKLQNNYFEGSPDSLKFIKLKVGKVPSKLKTESKLYVFKTYFYIDSSLVATDLAMMLGTSNFPSEIYLNKHKIARIGSYKEKYTPKIFESKEIFLPSEFLNYGNGKKNEICIQAYPLYNKNYTLDTKFISTIYDVNRYTFWRNFVGIHLSQAAMVFTLFLSIYFLFSFLLKHDKSEIKYLYFSLFCLLFSMTYVNVNFTFDTISHLILFKISRIGLSINLLSLVLYTMSFTQLWNKSKILKLIFIIPILTVASILLFKNSYIELENAFERYFVNIIMIPSLLFTFTLSLYAAIKKKDLKHIFYFICITLFIYSCARDSYVYMLGVLPYIWFVPQGFLILIAGTFVILTNEQVSIHRLAVKRAAELQTIKDNLEITIQERTLEIQKQNIQIQTQSETLIYANLEINAQNRLIADELEQRIIINKELEEKSVKLKESNATKDKFFSIIAHDLRSPFNTILGFSNILVENFDDFSNEEIKEISSSINTSSIKTYKLLENLLEWAKIQMNKVQFYPENIDLDNLIKEVIEIVEIQASHKNIKIKNNINNNFELKADRNMLHSIIRNLITNAIKFTPKFGLITLDAKKINTHFEITVSDTGVGMSEEHKNKLFKITEKVTNPGTENEPGTGLGLLLCKEFIERHNGLIWAESIVGKGSEFKISLPEINNFSIN